MRRKRGFVVFVLALLVLAVFANSAGAATEGERYFKKTWRDGGDLDHEVFGFKAGLTATDVKDLIAQFDNGTVVSGTATAVSDAIDALSAVGPLAASVAAAVGLGDVALRSCSHNGTRGIVLHGFSWAEHKSFVADYDPSLPDSSYLVRIYLPYWCSAQ